MAEYRLFITEGSSRYDILLSSNWMQRISYIYDYRDDYITIRRKRRIAISIYGRVTQV